jgi:hypothetical protein
MKPKVVYLVICLFFILQTAMLVHIYTMLSEQINDTVNQVSLEVGCRMGDDTACDIIRRGVIAD